jgi:hypothetical protein
LQAKNFFPLQLTPNIWLVEKRGTKYAFSCPFYQQLLQKISGFSAIETFLLVQRELSETAHGTYYLPSQGHSS